MKVMQLCPFNFLASLTSHNRPLISKFDLAALYASDGSPSDHVVSWHMSRLATERDIHDDIKMVKKAFLNACASA